VEWDDNESGDKEVKTVQLNTKGKNGRQDGEKDRRKENPDGEEK
jgi:hypothetical protein